MSKKPTVTIGIPAYNEEANIAFLLRSLLAQKEEGYKLTKIIVVSDGSLDQTEKLVRCVADKRIVLRVNSKRLGLNLTQNVIVRMAKSDLLILLNADILPKGRDFLADFVEAVVNSPGTGLVSCKILGLRVRSFSYGRVLANSLEMRRYLYEHLPTTDNVYLCHGSARIFRKNLYQKIIWPEDVPEDAYSYFFAKKSGFNVHYARQAAVYICAPATLSDHEKQHTRFVQGRARLKKYFPGALIESAYRIPWWHYLKALSIYTLIKPFSIPVYCLLLLFLRLKRCQPVKDHGRYDMVTSTKRIDWERLLYNNVTMG